MHSAFYLAFPTGFEPTANNVHTYLFGDAPFEVAGEGEDSVPWGPDTELLPHEPDEGDATTTTEEIARLVSEQMTKDGPNNVERITEGLNGIAYDEKLQRIFDYPQAREYITGTRQERDGTIAGTGRFDELLADWDVYYAKVRKRAMEIADGKDLYVVETDGGVPGEEIPDIASLFERAGPYVRVYQK